jgi:hypothetical protein
MIRPIDIRLNAAHPELPLAEAVTFTGAPSTVLIRGVPPNCGRWAITAVFVAATYPDGSTTTRAAVQSANGVWVATLPATARSGRTENGLRVMADGIDENGAAVTGYILGVADFAVASLGVTPAPEPGETSWQMLYFDAVPGTLRKGDVAKVDGVLKFYNGTAWEPFAGDIPAPSAATPAMDGTGAAGTSAAFARGDHVHPTDTSRMAASATGADIAVSGTDATKISAALAGKADDNAVVKLSGNQIIAGNKTFVETTQFSNDVLVESGNLVIGTVGSDDTNFYNVGIRTYGHSAPIQYPEYNGLGKDFFALIQHIAPDYDGETSHTYAVNELRAYQGAVYRCMTAHTATAWVAANWALATVEDVLAALRTGKADKCVPQTAGNLAALDASGNPTDSTIPAANVAVKGNIPYDRITITTGQLQDHAEQKVTLNAATTTLSLPALTDLTGKVSDFGIDVVNGYEVSGTPTAASFSLAGTIGTDYNLIVPKGEDWSEMSALAAGEMAVYYFTLSAFQINDKPTWEVMKKVVELVPVPVAP